MSRRRENYKQHVVEATSHEINDEQGGYSVDIFIEDHTNKQQVSTTQFWFDSPQRFKTDEDALAAAIQHGKQQIDRGYKAA